VIESRFWRDELRTDIRWLKKNQRYKRWSEKQLVLFERKLMLVAFQVRTLLDRPKVNAAVRSIRIEGCMYKKVGKKPYTLAGSGDLVDHFDVSSPTPIQMSPMDLCNQLIHHYVLATISEETGHFTLIAVFSDYKRHTCLYEFKVPRVIEFFSRFAEDSSANYGGFSLIWNEKKQDYDSVEITEATP
jgi:hypothetical protein